MFDIVVMQDKYLIAEYNMPVYPRRPDEDKDLIAELHFNLKSFATVVHAGRIVKYGKADASIAC